MKRRQLYSFAFAALFLFTVSSCKKSTNEHSEDHGVNDMTGEAVPITNSDVEIPDTSSVAHVHYVCPMACEGKKKYDENVPCPVCKMELKKIEHEGH